MITCKRTKILFKSFFDNSFLISQKRILKGKKFFFEAKKPDDKNSFAKKTRARTACIILFDETFRLSHYQSYSNRIEIE